MNEPVSKLQEILDAGQFAVTGEIGPPKGTNVEPALHEAQQYLEGRVAAVNVTDIQTAVMRLGSMAVLALESDLLSAYTLGIRNVLALTGDHVAMGDHREAKCVFDLDSVGLLEAMARLEAGTDLGRDAKGNPNQLDGVPKFFKGCCVTPCADEVEPQIIKLEKKATAGAQFVQTQAVYDPAAFEKFMNQIQHVKVPVLVGIVLLKSAGMAKYMNRSVPGVQVPDAIVQRLTDAPKEDRAKVSVEIAAELIRAMKPMCQGAHLMTLGWDHCVPDIIQQAELA